MTEKFWTQEYNVMHAISNELYDDVDDDDCRIESKQFRSSKNGKKNVLS